jgi:hypothetical protein
MSGIAIVPDVVAQSIRSARSMSWIALARLSSHGRCRCCSVNGADKMSATLNTHTLQPQRHPHTPLQHDVVVARSMRCDAVDVGHRLEAVVA